MFALSPKTKEIILKIFPTRDFKKVQTLLIEKAGINLPFYEKALPEDLERIQFGILKESNGDLGKLLEAINLAQLDGRDLLMNAGFAHDINAHEKWANKLLHQ